MTNREQLIEQYEDARFALLMEELAEEEGAELLRLNDALLTDPAAAVPKGAERRGEQLIGAAFAKRRRCRKRAQGCLFFLCGKGRRGQGDRSGNSSSSGRSSACAIPISFCSCPVSLGIPSILRYFHWQEISSR